MKKILMLLFIMLFGATLVGCNGLGTGGGNGGNDDETVSQIFNEAKEMGFIGEFEDWQKVLKGSSTKSPYELALGYYYSGSLSDWLKLLNNSNSKEIVLSVDDDFLLWKNKDDAEWKKLVSFSKLGGTSDQIFFVTTPDQIIYSVSGQPEWKELLELDVLNYEFGEETTQYSIAKDLGFDATINDWFTFIMAAFPDRYEFDVIDEYIQWSFKGQDKWNKIVKADFLYTEENQTSFTITYVDEMGHVLDEIEVKSGEYLSIPDFDFSHLETQTVEGYYYYNFKWDFENYIVTSDMVLVVVMEKVYYNLSFATDGGELSYEMNKFSPSISQRLPDCYKDGYIFSGWYLDSDYTALVSKTSELPHNDTLLYAKFEENNISCAEDPTQEICYDPETWTWNYNRTEFDGKGMTVVIYHDNPAELDPFDSNYIGDRQKERQALLNTIEIEYNIDIEIKHYPDEAVWGPSRVEWLINNAQSSNPQGDIYVVHDYWLPSLAYADSIALLHNRKNGVGLFQELNYVQSEEKNKQYSIGNSVYGYSSGEDHADQFLFYNQSLVEQFGLEDPATLWNEGRWDWSTFYSYLQTAQSAFDASLSSDNQAKIYAFGGFVNDIARGMLAARGGKLIDPDSLVVLFRSVLAIDTYSDLREIWQVDMWATDSTSVDVSESFRAGNQLFTHGNLWFLTSERRFKNDQINFEISAVPYPTADGDASTRNKYSIATAPGQCYTIRSIENGQNGISSLVLLNILDDLMRGIKPQFNTANMTEDEIYITYLQQQIENQESVDAIMSVEENLSAYAYIDYMDIVSKAVGNGSDWQGSGFATWGMSLVTSDEDHVGILSSYRDEYQNKLNEILNF